MKFDHDTIRLLGRLTDQMNMMRKHPHRYDGAEKDIEAVAEAAEKLEKALGKVRTVPVG